MACSESRTKRRAAPSSARALLLTESAAGSSEQGMAAEGGKQKVVSAGAGRRENKNLPPGRAHRARQGRGLPQRARPRPSGGSARRKLPSEEDPSGLAPALRPARAHRYLNGSSFPTDARAPAPATPTRARSLPSHHPPHSPERAPAPARAPPTGTPQVPLPLRLCADACALEWCRARRRRPYSRAPRSRMAETLPELFPGAVSRTGPEPAAPPHAPP